MTFEEFKREIFENPEPAEALCNAVQKFFSDFEMDATTKKIVLHWIADCSTFEDIGTRTGATAGCCHSNGNGGCGVGVSC